MYQDYADKPYTDQGQTLPDNLKNSLIKYAEHGWSTGGFLKAVLSVRFLYL